MSERYRYECRNCGSPSIDGNDVCPCGTIAVNARPVAPPSDFTPDQSTDYQRGVAAACALRELRKALLENNRSQVTLGRGFLHGVIAALEQAVDPPPAPDQTPNYQRGVEAAARLIEERLVGCNLSTVYGVDDALRHAVRAIRDLAAQAPPPAPDPAGLVLDPDALRAAILRDAPHLLPAVEIAIDAARPARLAAIRAEAAPPVDVAQASRRAKREAGQLDSARRLQLARALGVDPGEPPHFVTPWRDLLARVESLVAERRRQAPPVDVLRAAVMEMREHRDTITSSRIGRLIRAADALFPRDTTPPDAAGSAPQEPAEPVDQNLAGARATLRRLGVGAQEPAEPARDERCPHGGAGVEPVCAECRGEARHAADALGDETSDEEGGRHG